MSQELLFSDSFQEYRKKEIEEGVKVVSKMFDDNMSPDYIRGAMNMLKKVIEVPSKLAITPEAKLRAVTNIQRDLKLFQVQFLRRYVEE